MKTVLDCSCRSISASYLSTGSATEHKNGDHCHDRYEITYFISASGRYIVEGVEHKVTRGSLIIIRPKSYHRAELEDTPGTECYTVYFSKEALPSSVVKMLDTMTAGEYNHGHFYRPGILPEDVLSTFDRFAVSDKLEDEAREMFMQAVLTELLVLLSSVEGESMVDTDEELGARVARYINLNIERNVSLDRLAKRFFVSKYYLCRAFKSYCGTSPHAYINQKRIIHAKGLIESGMTASGAAERVGFGDYSAFYRAYVKIVGKSPTAE